jgi:hypothetical protein
LLAILAPLVLGSGACTLILGPIDFDGSTTSTGGTHTGGTGGTTNASTTHAGGGGSTGGTGGHEAGAPPVVTPASPKVAILRALQLSANVAVTWSVVEANGGKVDANGKYLSPDTPGTYHVDAISKADGQKATVAVEVGALGIQVLAGSNGGPGNNDGAAKHAHFLGPSGVASINTNGDALILADTGNHTLRRYDRSATKVTTLAGSAGRTGTADATGPAAGFNGPTGVVVNNQHAFVCDTGNNCIRDVGLSAGDVSTLAGKCGVGPASTDGTGSAARFDTPGALTVNSAGTALYVCDKTALRRIDLSSGATTTVRSGMASCDIGPVDYRSPYHIYFTDGSSPPKLHRFTEGTPPTFEALDAMPAAVSGGLATDVAFGEAGHSVYAAFQGAAIFAYDLDTSTFGTTAFVGQLGQSGYAEGVGAAALFNGITAVGAAAGPRLLYVAERGTHAVREVSLATRTVAPRIGTPWIVDRLDGAAAAARFTKPMGLAADANGAVYVADVSLDTPINNTVRKWDPQTGAVSTLAGVPNKYNPPVDGAGNVARFGLITDLVFDGTDLYVADPAAFAVRKVDLTGNVTTIAGQLGTPGAADGTGTAARFGVAGGFGPVALAADRHGNLYVADAGNYAIRKIVVATGEVTTLAGGSSGSANGTGKSAQFVAPLGLALDGNTLYIADAGDSTIRALDLGTLAVTTLVGVSGSSGYADGTYDKALFDHPQRLVADGLGNLFVSEVPQFFQGALGTIRRVDIATRATSTFAGKRGVLGLAPGPLSSATVNAPAGMALMPNGDLVFGDLGDYALALISPL